MGADASEVKSFHFPSIKLRTTSSVRHSDCQQWQLWRDSFIVVLMLMGDCVHDLAFCAVLTLRLRDRIWM